MLARSFPLRLLMRRVVADAPSAYPTWRAARGPGLRLHQVVVRWSYGVMWWMRNAHPVPGIPFASSAFLLDRKTSRQQDRRHVLTSWGRQVVTRDEAGTRPESRQVVIIDFFANNNSVSLLAVSPSACLQTPCREPAKRLVVSKERETGFEPATVCLESRCLLVGFRNTPK